MKKRILVVSIVFLTIVISILASSYNTNTRKTFIQDGVTYALTLDGESVNTIPQKGMYQVDVECENATGKWLYDEWKLRLTNMSTDNVTCNLAFTTITKTNLNNYIIGLSGTTQGTGEVVDEPNATIVNYTNASPIAESNYSNVTMYEGSSYSSTSGTTNTNSFTYSGGNWSSVPSNLTSGDYYHIKFRPSTSGYSKCVIQ